MIQRRYHELLLLGSLVLLATTFAIFDRADRQRVTTTFEAAGVAVPTLSPSDSLPASIGMAAVRSLPASSRTDEWQFRLFTPPPMVWDAATNTFMLRNPAVTGPDPSATGMAIAGDPGAEPNQNHTPRLQLLGYVEREAGAIAGIFQNVETAEIAVAASDSPIDGWQTLIERVELEPLHLEPDEGAVRLPRARAVVHDERQNRTYALLSDAGADLTRRSFAAVSETDAALALAADSDRER